MSLPLRLTLVRHGQSEANVVQHAQKNGETFHLEQEINSRVDWEQRLTNLGRAQAADVRKYLEKTYGDLNFFDTFYLSPFIRTRETAVIIGENHKNLRWQIDDRLSERIWGIYGVVSFKERRSHFPLTSKLTNDSPWYIRYDGGESLFDVYNRFKAFKEKLWRENSGQNVLIVSHQQLIQTVCYDIEKMLPEDWNKIWQNQVYILPNAGTVEYSRVNPNDATDIREEFSWRRVIHPANLEGSPLGGEWVEFAASKIFSAEEIKNQLSEYPTLIKE